MTDRFRLTLAQLNPVVGDLAGNAAKARAAWADAKAAGSDLVAFPEMFIAGYQLQDLASKPAFQCDVMMTVEELARDCADGPAIAMGCLTVEGDKLYNSYWICEGGTVTARLHKHRLPNEDVFDEVRVYDSGPISEPYQIGPLRIGSPICEDSWHPEVAAALAGRGAEILLVPNGSPYRRDKHALRQRLMRERVAETGLPLVYLNMWGGQDDQVFDGCSFAVNPGGKIVRQLGFVSDDVTHLDFERTSDGWRAVPGDVVPVPDAYEADYRVMVQALRDYCAKTGFGKVLLGLSGGIDSALVAVIAADALGPENVRCVMLPSEYTSRESLEDAAAVAKMLGCQLHELPISGPRQAVTEVLAPLFEGMAADVTEENIQSRLRGVLLMALSNKFGEMLLTTGNKSEVAVGYATIYGDMSGGFNPIKDLYKTRVFETCRWRNTHHRDWMMGPEGPVMPERVIDKPPSAELRPDQKDEDSLPPYAVLDEILHMLIDEDASVAQVVALGHDRALVERVEKLIYISEYKRSQSAPGTRLTKRAFWLDRRYPIVNRWRDRR
ncbi:NAD+ synthase [Palleronia caenipelagi]|uniref:Glutamine-dependent NAD(+) synthetase n=1 Tax=Palleronia caenipelagi TaxID=2489174 RepID=A0A547QAU5_9RHOB|nr:NAD+ synthase [Palleronia caenipelagi]TRD23492.1 NAD+ synthase [Palleronia caenipelagi]